MTEKYGGLWLDQVLSDKSVEEETYDPDMDAISVIYHRNTDGHYMVGFYIKGPGYPWSLPIWGDIARGGIFGELQEARHHLDAVRLDYKKTLEDQA